MGEGTKKSLEEVKECLKKYLVEFLEEEDIGEDMGFFTSGMNSIMLEEFVDKICNALDIELDSADVFDYPNVNELAEYIVNNAL